jgi:thymidylate kinase
MKIYHIGFDGLNHSGKGTAINYFSRYLVTRSIPHKICRGDGVRFGLGDAPYDFESSWWQENVGWLLMKDVPESELISKLNIQYQRLCREAIYHEKLLIKENMSDDGIILFDRSYVSRLFTMRQFFPEISLEAALQCYNPKTGKSIEPIIPERTYILYAPKDVLFERVEISSASEPKKAVIRKILNERFGLFEQIVNELCEREDIILINSDRQKEIVFKEIIDQHEKV